MADLNQIWLLRWYLQQAAEMTMQPADYARFRVITVDYNTGRPTGHTAYNEFATRMRALLQHDYPELRIWFEIYDWEVTGVVRNWMRNRVRNPVRNRVRNRAVAALFQYIVLKSLLIFGARVWELLNYADYYRRLPN